MSIPGQPRPRLAASVDDGLALPFRGFHPLTGNFLYCPNQFFDACLPHCSRGAVRLVAYLLRRTLGWLDELGRPIEQRVTVAYSELIDQARISSGAIRAALDEAIAGKFVRCVTEGRANAKGVAAKSARYELLWDDRPRYQKLPGEFAGFFAGDGHRSPIPNDFFDVVIPTEPLAVIQVVGAVLRYTVGYQVQFGGRRQQAPLSHSFIQTYTQIKGRHHVQAAIRHALDANYIRLIKPGTFSPTAGRNGEAAHYAVQWSGADTDASKRLPATSSGSADTTHQKGDQPSRGKRPEKVTSNASKQLPAGRVKKVTEEKTITKDTLKQQQPAVADEVVDELMKAGFDRRTARDLTTLAGAQQILNQIRWLDRRNATRNRLGMLRRAIVEDWAEPQATEDRSPEAALVCGCYAALASNAGTSVAVPTASDLAAARRLISRIANAATPDNAEQIGRQFGALARDWRGSTKLPPSFAAVARSFGDRFVAHLDAQQQSASRAASQLDAKAREQQLRERHTAYLLESERTLRDRRPADYAAFEVFREGQREQRLRSRTGAKHLVAFHDSEAGRLDDLLAFFSADVMDYRRWCAAQRASASRERSV
jgi:hypothetical protein